MLQNDFLSKGLIMKKVFSTLVIVVFIITRAFTQSVGIGTDNPAPSALLDVSTDNKGVLIPRLTDVQMNAIASPANGLMIFNSDHNRFYYFDGLTWTAIVSKNDGANNLMQVTAKDSVTTHNMIVGDTSKQWTIYRDTIVQVKKFQNTTGLVSAPLQSIRTEKYGMNYAPYGKVGSWNRYITRNWYNSNGRPGEVLTRESYNTNGGGGPLLPGEGAWSHVLESEWNRQFEDYVQVTLSTGLSYRPFAMYIDKDTALNDITFKASIFHVNAVGVAEDFLNVKNGKLVLRKVYSAPSEVSNTLFSMINGSREINIINNTQSLVFNGAVSYAFDNTVNPINQNVVNLGTNTSRWKNVFTNTVVSSYVAVPDANYIVLETDHTLNFKNITANRTITLASAYIGRRLELVTGQNAFQVNFTGIAVKNIDGTAVTALPAGKSCTLSFDGTNWWVIAVSSAL